MDQVLQSWIAGLNEREARVRVFERIRDIPWYVVPAFRDPRSGPALMLRAMRGSCIPKHYLLGKMFSSLGIPIRYATYPFSWRDVHLPYPPHLIELIPLLPIQHHLACKAHLNGRWILIDATWDPPLGQLGLPINAAWNGISDTTNAVPAIEEIEHATPEERCAFVEGERAGWSAREAEATEAFFLALSDWFEDVRRRSPPTFTTRSRARTNR